MASRKALSLILLCTFSISCCYWADGASQSPASAPGPSSVDCSSLIYSLTDCLSFVLNDSTTTKPEGNCCSGLKTVLSTKAECLCESFKTSAQAGIVLNVTKALSLPSVCKIHAPPASNCGLLALSPSGAPAPAPGGSAPGPAVSGGGNEQAPAPSPDGASQSPASAPGPSSVDCTNLIISMADCLSFVSNGSATTKPEGNCCSGLKTVLNTKAECLCEAFKTSAQAGIVLNVTKALSLPSVCKIHAPPASNCGLLALSPSGAPGGSAPGPAVSGGGNGQAPAPSLGHSGSIGFSISVGSLIIGFVVPSFFSF